MIRSFRLSLLLPLFSVLCFSLFEADAAEPLELKEGQHVSLIGNTLADRMQHDGWLETYLQALNPKKSLTFRNLGFAGDEIANRPRSANFGSPDQWLAKTEADVVFCFFGYNEALRGESALAGFEKNLADMITGMQAQKYNGESAPTLVVCSPIAHENLKSPHLPDGSENNQKLELYTEGMRKVCKEKNVLFVDLFNATRKLYEAAEKPLTLNGIHLLPEGNRQVAEVLIKEVFGKQLQLSTKEPELQKLREAVLDKNLHWFSRYRVVDGYNVYGGRSKLNWFGQSNADVMKREMEIFDVMTANRDQRIWAIAQGGDLVVKDDNLPKELAVQTNKPGQLDGGKHPYLTGEEGMKKMTLAKGMQVNLFASEDMFPEMVNPVQMAVDPDGRLFASVWPSYPHWNPTQPRTDRIVCLPDDNGDGVADKCVVFADKLNSITGFEFWGGGILVAAPPEIWFLKDTDGDDKADVKIRMLQGLSSADTHHTANAMVIGPDGWLYWSRGVFHVTNMETPTKTFRSNSTGVYRFNPRTFEMEFHFPIGPNPHGDVFDQWGFQFANDGTSGTGSYVNIGKGIGNRHWFKKRVRPVAATGLLSSSHFPEANNGNFLICNCIGVLGVLQHEVKYNGAEITAEEIEPVLLSDDPNFRPTDVEIGGDGALYISDWSNALIGHMQHNIRDPNRDHAHGRIYRVTYKGRELVKRVKLRGKPIAEVCQAFYAKENSTRYRARLELSGRDSGQIKTEVSSWVSKLDPAKPDDAQAMLECLWVFEEQRMPNLELLKRVLSAEEPRVRAAAIRTLGHWSKSATDWEPLLLTAARDASPLVRAEAVKTAVEFTGLEAAEVVFEVATRQTDPELEVVLNYGRSRLNVDSIVQDALKSGKKLSVAAQTYVLRNASVNDLLKMERTEAVYVAILSRENAPTAALRESLEGLAPLRKSDKLSLLLDLIDERDVKEQTGLSGLGQLLMEQPSAELRKVERRIEKLTLNGKTETARQIGFAAWIATDGTGDNAYLASVKSKDRLREFLAAITLISNQELRGALYAKVRPLIYELPGSLKAEASSGGVLQNGINVDYFYPSGKNVAKETLEKMTPQASGIVPQIVMNVPQRKQADKFALRFTGMIQAERSGKYTFHIASDDGSRIYLNEKLLVNNDGLHGMVEKSASVDLPAGLHPLMVTYFDNGGGDGLSVNWSGPGFKKRPIAADKLSISGGETLHDVAIRTLGTIPGHEVEKVQDLARLVKAGKNRTSAIQVLRTIPLKHWPAPEVGALVDNLMGYITRIPAQFRTGKPALDAIALANSLTTKLSPEEAAGVKNRLANLNVPVIAIGTVPHRMIYDKEVIAVQAGKPVEFRFSNTDNMPHNFAIVQPGALEEIGLLAEATARTPDAMERQYIPKSNKILLASRLLQTGDKQALTFEAPKTPGIYPYVCTYPGHWRRMFGTLYVVENLEEYQANPETYLAKAKLPMKDELLKYNTRGREWTFDELISEVKPLPMGRSFPVGKQLFKVANCIACHRLNNEGNVFGPDLAKLEVKKQATDYILRSLLEPSKDIEEKFRSQSFLMVSGKIITGMVTKETDVAVEVVIDPLAKAKPTVLKKSEIEERLKSPVSIMPKGLLNKLTQEEILDLIAYIHAGGNEKHPVFMKHDHQHPK